ncbi:cell division protein ZapA [Metabacillus indicus]|uniref:cell division protein ZapA n=1 Tax=Metabacillus indicus TaxID=246786 RepID=UPI002491AEFC|nr:cell division protein ZapA [Metabacillus indicus]
MEDFSLDNHSKKKTTVDIYGQQFSIVGTESTSHVRLVASIVDDKMREISSKSPNLDINKLAVLTAVNVVHEYLKLRDEFERLERQITEKD